MLEEVLFSFSLRREAVCEGDDNFPSAFLSAHFPHKLSDSVTAWQTSSGTDAHYALESSTETWVQTVVTALLFLETQQVCFSWGSSKQKKKTTKKQLSFNQKLLFRLFPRLKSVV